MHVPSNTGFAQFDDQILRLAKLAIDYLNEAEITPTIKNPLGADAKGISKLERLLEEQGLEDLQLCSRLRRVQGARSRSAAHSKGHDFDSATLLDGAPDLRSLFRQYLDDLIASFDALSERLRVPPASPEGS